MFDNNDQYNGGIQFAMSHELIAFLRWLAENDPKELEELAKKAISSGALTQMQADVEQMSEEETHDTIIDFFTTMEVALHEAFEDHGQHTSHHAHLQQTIDQIDGAFCDTDIVKTSLERVTNNSLLHPEKSAKELLFNELLKQWHPHNSQPMN